MICLFQFLKMPGTLPLFTRRQLSSWLPDQEFGEGDKVTYTSSVIATQSHECSHISSALGDVPLFHSLDLGVVFMYPCLADNRHLGGFSMSLAS